MPPETCTREAENAVVRDLATEAAKPDYPVAGVTAYRLPAGTKLELVEHEQFYNNPERRRGTVAVNDVDSLERYLSEQADPSTTVWVNLMAAEIVAVIDDHDALLGGETSAAGWAEHRARLTLIPTPEWVAWMDADKKLMDQEDFAEFIEERQVDIVRPLGADVLELAQTLHATTSAEFTGSTRLATGQTSLKYAEDVQVTGGANRELAVPQELLIRLAPYYGEPPVDLVARFRVRVRDGKASLGVRLDRPEEARLSCLKALLERLRETYPRTFAGAPRGAESSGAKPRR